MQIHVVKAGESLWKISQTYGIPLQTIVDANKLTDPGRLAIGQALVIPTTDRIHTVQPGESLWLISRRYGVSVDEIVRLNNIQNPASIPVGMRLTIPKTRPTVETNA